MRPHAVREALFGGRGAVRVWNLLPSAPLPPFSAVLACELEPGGAVGRHVQEQFPEVVIVVEGAGVARVGERSVELAAGSVVELALGQTLALESTSSSEPLRYLIVKAG